MALALNARQGYSNRSSGKELGQGKYCDPATASIWGNEREGHSEMGWRHLDGGPDGESGSSSRVEVTRDCSGRLREAEM